MEKPDLRKQGLIFWSGFTISTVFSGGLWFLFVTIIRNLICSWNSGVTENVLGMIVSLPFLFLIALSISVIPVSCVYVIFKMIRKKPDGIDSQHCLRKNSSV